jgi:HPt (histidine-containing phosphotransfer) domain-containing protein
MAWRSPHAPKSALDAVSQDGVRHRAARAALFSAELLRRVDAIARAIGAGEAGVVASEANALATGASAFGLAGLAEDALRAERAARDGAMDEVATAFRILQCGVHAALAALRAG